MGFPDSSVGKESACNVGNLGSIPGLGRSAGKGKGYSLQYSWASLVSACNAGDLGTIPWRRKSLPLHNSSLENSMECTALGRQRVGPNWWTFTFTFFQWMEKEMAAHSSILAWKIPWTERPGGLEFIGSQSWIPLGD